MGRLLYGMITSADGFITDADGGSDWGGADEGLHRFIDEQYRSVGTYLYGRRMYETMRFWETAHEEPDAPPFVVDYARGWQAADKVVYSRTLTAVSTARTRLERQFDPVEVQRLKREAPGDLTIDGATLAAEALRAGLVDEVHLFVSPVVVGGGTRFLPDGVRLDLELLDERRFGSGVVFLRYGVL